VDLPSAFCWTKFGTEAGEPVDAILRRKEAERLQSGGVFLWGIGSSVRPSLVRLLECTANPQVIFTPMRSAPAEHGVRPAAIVTWRRGTAIDGRRFVLPDYTVVTSGVRDGAKPGRHYALVCQREAPLRCGVAESLSLGTLRNLASGADVGFSQVTSIVEYDPARRPSGPKYTIAFRAQLVYPYLLSLAGPISDSPSSHAADSQEAWELGEVNDLIEVALAGARCAR
jgi:hypothetical protein